MVQIGEWAGLDDWSIMDPLGSPKVLIAYLAVLYGAAKGVGPDVAGVEIMKRPLPELIACVTQYGNGG